MVAARVALVVVGLATSPMTSKARRDDVGNPVHSAELEVGDTRFHYLEAGHGPTILLLHGFTQTSEMWRPVINRLARNHRVIAPDLPGFGASSIPADGLDMKAAAVRIRALARALGVERSVVIGHDIGLMVGYAYAALYGEAVDKVVLMDAFLPGVGHWEAYVQSPRRWHFTFNGPTAEALVAGRERIYLEHFWNDFAADPRRSLPEEERSAFSAAYAAPGRMRAAWAYFRAIPQTAREFAILAQHPLAMPVLVLAGEKAAGTGLAAQVSLVGSRVASTIISGSGHWLIEERPEETIAAIEAFVDTASP